MKADLLTFYLDGRGVKQLSRLRKLAPDAEEITQSILAGKDLREEIQRCCYEAKRLLAGDRKYKAKWLKDNDHAVAELEADENDAFDAFMHGMADELCYSLEHEVLGVLEEEIDGPADEDDESGDGGGDEDGEEDESAEDEGDDSK